jgi:3-carboxy-cis,cis-muconate cycloisomerase
MTPLVSQLHAQNWVDARVAALFEDVAQVRFLLQVEAALAQAQGRLGIIPQAAATALQNSLPSFVPDLAGLQAGIATDGFPVLALLEQLRRHLPEAADFVHFGATTQDILDTALVLQLKTALEVLKTTLFDLITQLGAMAHTHRQTLMVGRTHTQHALPITFGLKVATWLAPLIRHSIRLSELEPRLYVVQFGGAVGTLAALEGRGVEIEAALATELKLGQPLMPWHTQRDSLAELCGWLSLLSASLGKIGQDVLLLGQSEIAEVREATGGGSSTMPHKSNPVRSEWLVAAARMNAGLLGNTHGAMLQEHERGTHGWQLEWHCLPQMLGLTSGALNNALVLLQGLEVNHDRMLQNLRASGGAVLSESLMFGLRKTMPPQQAKLLVNSWSNTAQQQHLSLPEVVKAAMPDLVWQSAESEYLGQTQVFIDRVLNAIPERTP